MLEQTRTRTMQQQQRTQTSQLRFEGKLKAHIIKQIFKDLGPKNLKGVQCFYLIVKEDLMEMQFTSGAKDILITIILMKNLFQSYQYTRHNAWLNKYSLQDFTGIGYMFENNKLILDLELKQESFTVTSFSGRGFTQFVATPLRCDIDDEDFIIQQKHLRPRETSSMRLTLQRASMFEGILSYAKGCKLTSLWFRFDSVRKMLEVTDQKDNHEIRWFLKVEHTVLQNFDRHMQFPVKALSCALNLLPNDEALILTFYEGFMLLDVPEKEKTFTVRINARFQES